MAILDQSIIYDEKDLVSKCLAFAGPRIQQVVEGDTFASVSNRLLVALAEFDGLPNEPATELLLYRGLVRWAENRCSRDGKEASDLNIREVLSDAIYRVRFVNMDPKEFAIEVGSRQILTDTEQSGLYYYFLTQNPEVDKSLKFDMRKRTWELKPNELKPNICHRLSLIDSISDWIQDGNPDAISLQTDKDIILIGISLYGAKTAGHHDVSISVFNDKDEVNPIFEQEGIDLDTNGSQKPKTVIFTKNVLLNANHIYTIVATVKGPGAYNGHGGNGKVSCGGINFTFTKSSKSTNGTDVQVGQIPQIIFNIPSR